MEGQYREDSKENGVILWLQLCQGYSMVAFPIERKVQPYRGPPSHPKQAHKKGAKSWKMPGCSKHIESFDTNVQCRPLSENKATVTIQINTNQAEAEFTFLKRE